MSFPLGIRMGIVILMTLAVFIVYLPILYFLSMDFRADPLGLPEQSSRHEESSTLKYIVNTPGCKIIQLDPFEDSIKEYLVEPELSVCSKSHFSNLEGQILSLNETFIQNWFKNRTISLSCCYRTIHRLQQQLDDYNYTSDLNVKYSECHQIHPGEFITIYNSYIRVECNSSDRRDVEFHGTVLPPKIKSTDTEKKALYWDTRASQDLPRPPSILVFGIDSISRLHMHRSLPKTVQILTKNDFIEVKGYTKVGDNTFPNIMAGFAGFKPNTNSSCLLKNFLAMDDCPLIWKNFSRLNYFTTHLEDSPLIAIFNNEKFGFVHPPADYYLRPFMLALDKFDADSPNCIAGESSTSFITNFTKQFVKLMGRNYPYFHFSWLTTLTHDDFNGLQTADDLFASFFTSILNNSNGDPDNTVIVFMSDHGNRAGSFRETFPGFYEVNLPFFYFRLPPSLKDKHPEWYTNLQRNSQMLTSPLDLHSSLSVILNEARSIIGQSSEPPMTTGVLSLFDHIPETRTCEEAHIPSEYCMCGVTPVMSKTSNLSIGMGRLIVAKVNDILTETFEDDLCYELSLGKFLYGRELGSGEDAHGVNFTDYLIAVETKPGRAHFEAKLKLKGNATPELIGDISRTNKYGDQSYCMKNAKLKLYCKCKGVYGNKKKSPRSNGTTSSTHERIAIV